MGVDGARPWYEREGEGFPVVLVHPGLWDARIWDPNVRKPEKFNRRVLDFLSFRF